MLEEKNIIQEIDDTIKGIDNIKNSLETAKQAFVKLENDKEELSNETVFLEREKQQLENEKIKLEQEKLSLEKEKANLEQATKQLEIEKQERDQKIGDLTTEQMKLLDEYQSLKGELKQLSKLVEDQEEAEFNFERIKALLSITKLLIKEIWQGQPHYRILLNLHGGKEKMSRDDIKNSTGISGAMVLRAIHELANIDVVEYDEDKGLVKLKKRLFAKKALSEEK
ncbi:MAG: hypothetical protein KGD57_00325 [Candidatus Lokiarchaeota archaeon]|nr:hypothetical protein [Candidatus Lokiarchaeota archaeon]